MCGITGIVVAPGRVPNRDLLERMNDSLARRGPDDAGYHLDVEGGCGLGHRRLSIIDLEGGHQPLGTSDGRVWAVVNGEIYNFVELREVLEKAGHRFTTRSDSEVVVHGYREWGEGVVARLEGMFAFALWDADERRLLLGRDRMGQKPLYYVQVGETSSDLGFAFASEAKALFLHPGVSRSPSPSGLASYLTYECVPEDAGLTEGMKKLLPGWFLVYERATGRLRREPYWQMRFSSSPAIAEVWGRRPPELVKLLRERITHSVKARLVADVPLGVFLSGGLDSSTVAAVMTRLVPASSVKTFSIAFEDPSFDESAHARLVAEHLGTDHHEERLSPSVMIDILPEVAAFMCEPLGDASVIPTYLLSRFTRKTVKVALGGDGGDEIFLGYPTFPADRVARVLDRVMPRPVQGLLGRVTRAGAGLLPVSRKNFSLDFKVKRFAQGLGFQPDERHQAWMGSFLPEELDRILLPDVRRAALVEHPYAVIRQLHESSDARDAEDRAVLQYSRLYLAGDVLAKVDRASMACGLEVRSPLLDRRVVELACAVPGKYKLRGLTTKYLLKEAARPMLPASIIDRPKKGFGVPIGDWIRGPLRSLACDLLSDDRIRREGFFEPSEVLRLLREHLEGRADHRKPLWTLLAFELWMDRHGPGSPE